MRTWVGSGHSVGLPSRCDFQTGLGVQGEEHALPQRGPERTSLHVRQKAQNLSPHYVAVATGQGIGRS